jgi:hypothetical protein
VDDVASNERPAGPPGYKMRRPGAVVTCGELIATHCRRAGQSEFRSCTPYPQRLHSMSTKHHTGHHLSTRCGCQSHRRCPYGVAPCAQRPFMTNYVASESTPTSPQAKPTRNRETTPGNTASPLADRVLRRKRPPSHRGQEPTAPRTGPGPPQSSRRRSPCSMPPRKPNPTVRHTVTGGHARRPTGQQRPGDRKQPFLHQPTHNNPRNNPATTPQRPSRRRPNSTSPTPGLLRDKLTDATGYPLPSLPFLVARETRSGCEMTTSPTVDN